MSKEYFASYGAELREKAEKSYHKWLFYGTTLLLLHLLDIEPTKIKFLDNDFAFKSPYVLYGAVSLLFLFYLYESFMNQYYAGVLHPFNLDRRLIRSVLARSKSKKLTIAAIKKKARWRYAAYTVFILPYGLFVVLVSILALSTSIYDVYRLMRLIVETSQSLDRVLASF